MSHNGVSTSSQPIDVFLHRWRIIAALTFICTVAAATVSFLMTPVYRSTTLLIPNEANERSGLFGSATGQLGGLASIAGLNLGGTSQSATTEALAVLQSRQFTQEFIDQNMLMPKLFATAWDAKANDWKRPLRPPTIGKAYKLFTTDIMDVYQDKKTNLVILGINWTDRGEAAIWANELVDRINARMRDRAISEADQTIRYLQQELRSADTVEVRSAIASTMETQLKTKALATVRKQYAFRVIDAAVAPDRDVVLRPHKGLYILSGFFAGLLLGIAAAFTLDGHLKRRANRV
jgi:uncharacterized protein involved in exopolysaccharide biosynthesis